MPRQVLAFVIICLSALTAKSQTTWRTYNHKNGFTLQLPSYFKEDLLVAAGTLQYYSTEKNKDITISVETFGAGTQEELQTYYDDVLKREDNIAYKVIKPGWFVISGQESEETKHIFYQKSIIKDGVLHHLYITYPEDQKMLFDGILGRIAGSFK